MLFQLRFLLYSLYTLSRSCNGCSVVNQFRLYFIHKLTLARYWHEYAGSQLVTALAVLLAFTELGRFYFIGFPMSTQIKTFYFLSFVLLNMKTRR